MQKKQHWYKRVSDRKLSQFCQRKWWNRIMWYVNFLLWCRTGSPSASIFASITVPEWKYFSSVSESWRSLCSMGWFVLGGTMWFSLLLLLYLLLFFFCSLYWQTLTDNLLPQSFWKIYETKKQHGYERLWSWMKPVSPEGMMKSQQAI